MLLLLLLWLQLSSAAVDEKCALYSLSVIDSKPIEDDGFGADCDNGWCIVVLVNNFVTHAGAQLCYNGEGTLLVTNPCSPFENYRGKQVKCQCLFSDNCDQPVDCSEIKSFCVDHSTDFGCMGVNTSKTTREDTPTISTTEISKKTTLSTTHTPGAAVSPETTAETAGFTEESTSLSTSTTTNTPPVAICKRVTCRANECFYQGHCYFNSTVAGTDNLNNLTCSGTGLKLALETDNEIQFILKLVMELHREDDNVIYVTSGVVKDENGTWSVWNRTFDPKKFSIMEPMTPFCNLSISSNGLDSTWNCLNLTALPLPTKIVDLCERVDETWSMVLPQYRSFCWREYDSRGCKGQSCCAVDSHDRKWFHCNDSSSKAKMNCTDDVDHQMTWNCVNGQFATEDPDSSQCRCSQRCTKTYQESVLQACSGNFAQGNCTGGGEGYLRWYCNSFGSFSSSEPEMNLCCGNQKPCQQHDPFLHVWFGCPNSTIERYTDCLAGHTQERAKVRWECTENGFVGKTPDYSECGSCETQCSQIDDYGQAWTSCAGEVAEMRCPGNLIGTALWLCGMDGNFINTKPDYSDCTENWLSDISEMIAEDVDAHTVMETIGNHVTLNTPSIGQISILNVTSSCIQLFIDQNNNNGSIELFEMFTSSYMRVLDSMTNYSYVWNNLVDNRRQSLIEDLINVTEKLAFSAPKIFSEFQAYDKSFMSPSSLGSNVLIKYCNDSMNIKLTSENSFEVKVEPGRFNAELYAAVAMTFPYQTAQVVFPSVSEKPIMNSDVVSMTIADMTSGEPEKQHNMGVQFTFTHNTRARFPQRKIISRKLYEGEEPSPILGNSSCFYYNTESSSAGWVQSGCIALEWTATTTTCTCHHLSSFSVLADIHEYRPDPVLETLSIVCSALSALALFATLVILISFRSQTGWRSQMGSDLCLCLLIAHILFLTVLDKKFFYISDSLCTVFALVLHYVLMAAFFWMVIEGYHLYRLVIVVFSSDERYHLKYLICGYGAPAIVCLSTEFVSLVRSDQAYGRDELCWLRPEYIWGFDGPAFALTAINLLIITMAMKTAVSAKLREPNVAQAMESIRTCVRGMISLSTLLGVTWLLGLAVLDDNPIFAYPFVILNGLQGVFIFLFRCVFNEQVRALFRRWLRTKSDFDSKGTAAGDTDHSAKTRSSVLLAAGEVKIIKRPSGDNGMFVLKTSARRPQSTNRAHVPVDEFVRKMHRSLHKTKNLKSRLWENVLKRSKLTKNEDQGSSADVSSVNS